MFALFCGFRSQINSCQILVIELYLPGGPEATHSCSLSQGVLAVRRGEQGVGWLLKRLGVLSRSRIQLHHTS